MNKSVRVQISHQADYYLRVFVLSVIKQKLITLFCHRTGALKWIHHQADSNLQPTASVCLRHWMSASEATLSRLLAFLSANKSVKVLSVIKWEHQSMNHSLNGSYIQSTHLLSLNKHVEEWIGHQADSHIHSMCTLSSNGSVRSNIIKFTRFSVIRQKCWSALCHRMRA